MEKIGALHKKEVRNHFQDNFLWLEVMRIESEDSVTRLLSVWWAASGAGRTSFTLRSQSTLAQAANRNLVLYNFTLSDLFQLLCVCV